MTSSIHAPSRFHLAIFRLVAVARLLSGNKEESDTLRYLAFAKGQSGAEVYAYSLIHFCVANLFLLATIQSVAGSATWTLVPLFIILVPATFFLISLSMFGLGFMILGLEKLNLVSARPHEHAQTVIHHALLSGVAVWSLTQTGWIRYVGMAWFAMLALNAAAAGILAIVAGRVAELERRHGAAARSNPFGRRREDQPVE